jgi:hypothetical protein
MSSLLKRLSEQASQIKAREAEVSQEQEIRRQRFDERIKPTMAALLDYLKEFSEQLRVVKPAVSYRYELPAYGQFQALSQHDYKLQDEARYTEIEIELRFRARVDTESAPRVQFRNVQLIKSITDKLREHALGGLREDRRGPTGVVIDATLQVSGFVHARLHVIGKAADENLCFTLSNVDRLGKVVRNIPVELMSDAVFDRLGEFLLRENDEFVRESWVRSLVPVTPFPFARRDGNPQRAAPAPIPMVEEPAVFEKAPEPSRTEAQARLLAPDEDLMRDLAEAARIADLAVMAQMGSLGAYSEPGMIDALPKAGSLTASSDMTSAPTPAHSATPLIPPAPVAPTPPPVAVRPAAAPMAPAPVAPPPAPVAPQPASPASPTPPSVAAAPAAAPPVGASAPVPPVPASIAAIAAIAASGGNTPEDEERRAAAEKFLARFKKLRKEV